jgi:hypothetical protein
MSKMFNPSKPGGSWSPSQNRGLAGFVLVAEFHERTRMLPQTTTSPWPPDVEGAPLTSIAHSL